MATLVTATNVEKLEYDVTTAEGAARVTVVTGSLPAVLQADSHDPNGTIQHGSFRALVDPVLGPGQFRKATAMVAVASLTHVALDSTQPTAAAWAVEEVAATLDDESGRIEIRIDLSVTARGAQTSASIALLGFQVTTLSRP